jgi:hypothetical protein
MSLGLLANLPEALLACRPVGIVSIIAVPMFEKSKYCMQGQKKTLRTPQKVTLFRQNGHSGAKEQHNAFYQNETLFAVLMPF